MIGASEDDLKLLMAKNFLIPFESGIVVIKHWRIHNFIRNDRYKETVYQEEKALLTLKENNVYTVGTSDGMTVGIPNGYQMEPQYRLGKDILDKDSIGEVSKGKDSTGKSKRGGNFVPPTLEEVTAYCQERGNNVDPQMFIDFYESKGWYVGKNKMKSWKASIRTWERSDRNDRNQQKPSAYMEAIRNRVDVVDSWI
mgnify:CR=1 FL=1